MNKIYFVTKNKHKFAEVNEIMKEYGIEVKQLKLEKQEHPKLSIEKTAEQNAKLFAKKYKPVMIDDTGIFFKAYKNFPGSNPKLIYNSIGFEGLLKLLKGKDRKAYFETAVGYSDGRITRVFKGRLNGKISTKVHNQKMDVQPYEKIFIPDGMRKTTSAMTRNEKNRISHRAKAFRKLAKYLVRK